MIVSNFSLARTIKIIIGRADWFPKFQYCDVRNGISAISINYVNYIDSIWGSGNISSNPNFRNAVNNNYQLDIQSSCINAGNPDTAGMNLPLVDLLDSNRVFYNRIDIGCYEFDSASYHTEGIETVIEKKGSKSTPSPFQNKLLLEVNNLLKPVEFILFDIAS
ncbi:MAG: hypothetical protein IPQ03_12990 [Bacteroidetes bacterium]|nr:hypothetical protein [Bacteroidota bacterium]